MGAKDVADELGPSKGDAMVSEKRRRDLMVKKASSKADRLEEIMDWNPSRTGKIAKVTPKAMKEIWKG